MRFVKVKGSTVTEVVIAMIITGLVFTLGISIYINIYQSISNKQRLQAQLALQSYLNETIEEKAFFSDSKSDRYFLMNRELIENKNGLIRLHFDVNLEGEVLKEFDYIVNENTP